MEESGLSVDAGSLGQLDDDQLEQFNYEHQFEFEAEGFDFNLDGVYDESAEAAAEDGIADAVGEIESYVKNIEPATGNTETAVIEEFGTAAEDISAMVEEIGTVAAVTDNDEIGYEDDEEDIQLGSAQLGQTGTAEGVQDIGADDETESEVKGIEIKETEVNEAAVDYQDEIGYEDDELGAVDISIDLKSEQAVEPFSEAAVEQPHEHSGPSQEVYNDSTQAQSEGEAQGEPAEVEDTATSNEQQEPAEHGEDEAMHDNHMDDDKENAFDSDNHDDVADEEYHDEEYHDESMLENYSVDQDEDLSQGPSDLDKAIEDLTNSLPSIPEVEVLYNDGSYSLFGTPDDDPETYFLSGTKHLERSLAELLSSLRQVLSEEIRPTDELLIGVEALGLEFGERSNEKFLARSLRELLDCHAALATKNYGDFPTQPTLRLMVQQDCEEQFLQLLQEAELEAESSDDSEDYNASEQQDEWPSANSLGDKQNEQAVQADPSEHDHSQESSAHDDDAASVAPVPDASSVTLNEETDQVNASMEQGFTFEDTLDDPEYQPSEAVDASEERPDEHMEDRTDEQIKDHAEEHTEDAIEPVRGTANNAVEITVGEDVGEANQPSNTLDNTADVTPHEEVHSVQTSQEASIEAHGAEQHGLGQSGDIFDNDGAGFEDLDEYVAASTGDGEHLGVFNGNTPFLFPPTNDISLSEIGPGFASSFDHITPATHPSGKARPQQVDQEDDYLIDYSDDDYSDDFPPPLSTKQTIQVPAGPDYSGIVVDNSASASLQSRTSGISHQRGPQAINGHPPVQSAYALDEVETRPEPEPAGAGYSLGGLDRSLDSSSDSDDTEMANLSSPLDRSFFASHSRTDSNQSFSFSHTSDANLPNLQDDELMLGYDNDAGLSTIDEHEDDEYDDITVTINAEDNAEYNNNDSTGNIESVEIGNLQHHNLSQETHREVQTTAGDAESIHTSTTMNGDEIDYEEHDAADDSLTPGASVQQSAASPGGRDDEIDWENDGYEYNEDEQNVVDASFASEEQKEVTLTPSSLAAKRSRTDEAESLAEESDNKRRRT
ncbi:hypothetical protein QBC44DRAFT_371601 [Cladorrhinum sp. PSN332]|nr:hypothetical protein QBC44DRAFT_371601 [Cladorrhinum sp. PSN332]